MSQMLDSSTSQIGDDEIIDVTPQATALEQLNRGEVDMQISTAKRYPRHIARAKQQMIEMACIDQETARGCGYALKRTDKDGKTVWIEGPSVRMAEIAVCCWGNVRYGARVIEETDKFIVAQGACYDLEKNVYNSIEVRRRITTKYGKKFGDDMVGVTANAACSIASRNAVFKVIPKVIVNEAYHRAMKVAGGDEKTFDSRRKSAVAAFQQLGVKLEELMAVLAKAGGGLEDIDTTDLRRLHGLLNAIQDGETTVDQVFRPQPMTAEEQNSALKERLDAAAKSAPKIGQATTVDPKTGEEKPEKKQETVPKPPAAILSDDELTTALMNAAMDMGLPESSVHSWRAVHVPNDPKARAKIAPPRRAEILNEYIAAKGVLKT
jgi:hypothetical protein